MLWWRHTGGNPTGSSSSECPQSEESGLSSVASSLSSAEEAQSADVGDHIIGDAYGIKGGVPQSLNDMPTRPAANRPPRTSARRCLSNSPSRGRSRLRASSSSIHSWGTRGLSLEGLCNNNPSGARSPAAGSDWLSLRSEEYLSACSDALSLPAGPEEKEVSFITGTSSPQSDHGSIIGPRHRGSLCSGSRMHTTFLRVGLENGGRLRSSPEGCTGASVKTAPASVRSLSLPLHAPTSSKAGSSLHDGAVLRSFRWVCRSLSNNGEGEDRQKALHRSMRALAAHPSSGTRRSGSHGGFLQEGGDSQLLVLDGRLSGTAPVEAGCSQHAIGESSDCRSNTEDYSKFDTCSGQLPAVGKSDAQQESVVESAREERVDDKRAKEHALPIAEPERAEALMTQEDMHGTDALEFPEHNILRSASYAFADDWQEKSPSSRGVSVEGFQALPEYPVAPPPAQSKNVAPAGEGRAVKSQQGRTDVAGGTVSSISHLAEELQTGAVASDPECGKVRRRNRLTTRRTLQRSFVEMAGRFGTCSFPGRRKSGGAAHMSCRYRVKEQTYQALTLHPSHVHQANQLLSTSSFSKGQVGQNSSLTSDHQVGTSLLTNNSSPDTGLAAQSIQAESDIAGWEARELKTQTLNATKKHITTGDPQNHREGQGSVRGTACEAGVTTCSNLSVPLEAAEGAGGLRDAYGLAAKPPGYLRRQGANRNGTQCCSDDIRDAQPPQASPTRTAHETGVSPCISLSDRPDAAEGDGSFQDASAVADEVPVELQRQASTGTAAETSQDNTHKGEGGQGSSPETAYGAGVTPYSSMIIEGLDEKAGNGFQDASDLAGENATDARAEMPNAGLSGTMESPEGCESFRDASDVAGGEPGEMKRQASSDNKVTSYSDDTHKEQTGQGSSPRTRDDAAATPCSSVSPTKEEEGTSDFFQDASDVACGRAAEAKPDAPCISLSDPPDAAEGGGSFQDASALADEVPVELQRQASTGTAAETSQDNTHKGEGGQGSSPETAYGAGVTPYSSMIIEGLDEKAGNGFQDASDLAGENATDARAEMPNVSLSGTMESPEGCESFRDASDVAGGEPGGMKRQASSDNKVTSYSDDTHKEQTGQGSSPRTRDDAAATPCSSVSPTKEEEGTSDFFQDASDVACGRVAEAKPDAPCISLSDPPDAAEKDGSFQDASAVADEVPVEMQRQASTGTAAETSQDNTHKGEGGQGSSPETAYGAGVTPYSSMIIEGLDEKAGNGFQDASDLAGENATDARAEMPNISLSGTMESPEGCESFRDASDVAGGEPGGMKRQASSDNKVTSYSDDTHKEQTGQGSSPRTRDDAAATPCSSVSPTKEEEGTSDFFQDALDAAGGRAAEAKPDAPCISLSDPPDAAEGDGSFQDASAVADEVPVELQRQASTGTAAETSQDNTHKGEGGQGSSPETAYGAGVTPYSSMIIEGLDEKAGNGFQDASDLAGENATDARAEMPNVSLSGTMESPEGCESFRDASDVAGGEPGGMKRQASSDNKVTSYSDDTHKEQTGQGSSPRTRDDAAATPCSSVSPTKEEEGTSDFFQDASDVACGRAAEAKPDAPCISLSDPPDAAEGDGSFQDASALADEVPVEMQRQASTGTAAETSQDNTHKGEGGQGSSPETAYGAGVTPYSSMIIEGLDEKAGNGFQDASDLAGENATDARAEMTNVGLSGTRESPEGCESFRDASDVAGGEPGEMKRQASSDNKVKSYSDDTHKEQTGQGSSPRTRDDAAATPCSSVSPTKEEEGTSDFFQDASDVACGRVAEAKPDAPCISLSDPPDAAEGDGSFQDASAVADEVPVELQRQASTGTAAETSQDNTHKGEGGQGSSPETAYGAGVTPYSSMIIEGLDEKAGNGFQDASDLAGENATDARAEMPNVSLSGTMESPEGCESFRDASDVAGGEPGGMKRQASSDNKVTSYSDDTRKEQTGQGSSPRTRDDAAATPCSSVSPTKEEEGTSDFFQDASDVACGRAAEAKPDAPCISLSDPPDAAEGDGSFQDASAVADEVPVEMQRQASTGTAAETSQDNTHKGEGGQGSSPETAYGAGVTPYSSMIIEGLDEKAGNGFQDASDLAGENATDARAEMPNVSLSGTRESPEGCESFRDASDVAGGEPGEMKRQASSDNKVKSYSDDTHKEQTGQGSSPRTRDDAAATPCSSVSPTKEEEGTSDFFQDALDAAGGRAAEAKPDAPCISLSDPPDAAEGDGSFQDASAVADEVPVELQRQASTGTAAETSQDNTHKGEGGQGSSSETAYGAGVTPYSSMIIEGLDEKAGNGFQDASDLDGENATDARAEMPNVSLSGTRESPEGCESFRDASDVAGGEPGEMKRQASSDNKVKSYSDDTRKEQTGQGSSPRTRDGAAATPCSSVSPTKEEEGTSDFFQDALDAAGGRAAGAKPDAPCISLSDPPDAAEGDGSFQDASAVADEVPVELQRQASTGTAAETSQDNTHKGEGGQGSSPETAYGAGVTPYSSMIIEGLDEKAGNGFQDASDLAGENATDARAEMTNVGLSGTRESPEGCESFRDASDVAGGEPGEMKRQASSDNKVKSYSDDTHKEQTGQGSSPRTRDGAAATPCSSVSPTKEEEGTSDFFQGALHIVGAEALGTGDDMPGVSSSDRREVAEGAESFRDASEMAGVAPGELKRQSSSASEVKNSSDDTAKDQVHPCSSPGSASEAGATPCSSSSTPWGAAETMEGFQDACEGAGGDAEELKSQAASGSRGESFTDDTQEHFSGHGASPVRGKGEDESLWSSFLSVLRHVPAPVVETAEELKGAPDVAAVEVGKPIDELRRGNQGTSFSGDTQEHQAVMGLPPASVAEAGALSSSILGVAPEVLDEEGDFQDLPGVLSGTTLDTRDGMRGVSSSDRREVAEGAESFRDASEMAGVAPGELKRQSSSASEVKNSSDDTAKDQVHPCSSPGSASEAGATPCSSSSTPWGAAETMEGFQDACEGAGGDAEELKSQAASGSRGESFTDDTQEHFSGHGASPVRGKGEDESLWSSFLSVLRHVPAPVVETAEELKGAPDVAAVEVGKPIDELRRGNQGTSFSGDTQEHQAVMGLHPASVAEAGALSSSILGVAPEALDEEGSFQDALEVTARMAKLTNDEGSISSGTTSSFVDTQVHEGGKCASPGMCLPIELNTAGGQVMKTKQDVPHDRQCTSPSGHGQEGQVILGAVVKGRSCLELLDPRIAPIAVHRYSETLQSSNEESSPRESPQKLTMLQNSAENCPVNSLSPAALLSSGEIVVADWRESTASGCGAVDSEGRQLQQPHELQQLRCPDELGTTELQNCPRDHFGSPSISTNPESAASQYTCSQRLDGWNGRHDNTTKSCSAPSGGAHFCCIHMPTEQYYIGSRSSSEASSSGSNNGHEDCSSGSESLSGSCDRSRSRSSCSSCCSEGRDQSGENIPTNSRDSSVYETFSSCMEFPSKSIGWREDSDPRQVGIQGRVPTQLLSSAWRTLARDIIEDDNARKPSNETTTTFAQAPPPCTNEKEAPLLHTLTEGLANQEGVQRQALNEEARGSSPTRSMLPASSSQAVLVSRQVATHCPPPPFGLFSALSSLAHPVFASQDPRTSASQCKDVAHRTQPKGAVELGLADAAQDQTRQAPLLPDTHTGVQVSIGAYRKGKKADNDQLDSRDLEGRPSIPDIVLDSNEEAGIHKQSLDSRLRERLGERYMGEQLPNSEEEGFNSPFGPAGGVLSLRGTSLPERAIAGECRALQDADGRHTRAVDSAKKRYLSSGNRNNRKGSHLDKDQLALTMHDGFGSRYPALRRHSGRLQLPHESRRLCSGLLAPSKQVQVESRANCLRRCDSTFTRPSPPAYMSVNRVQNHDLLVPDVSGQLAEDAVDSPGPRSTDTEAFESSLSAAENLPPSFPTREVLHQQSPASEGDRRYSVYGAFQSAEPRIVGDYDGGRRGAAQRHVSAEEPQNRQTGCFCGPSLVTCENTNLNATTDSPGTRSFSDTPADMECGNRRHTRWYSCGDLLADYGNARTPNDYEPSGGRKLERLALQMTHKGTRSSAQESSPSEPTLANSMALGALKSLDMETTNRILESAVDVALHKQPQGKGGRIFASRLRSEKLKMLLGRAGDRKPSVAGNPNVSASATANALGGHPTAVEYNEMMAKRLALKKPTLACRVPPTIFCGNFMSASSLWTLQLRRPVEEGGRPFYSSSSSGPIRKEHPDLEYSLPKEGYLTQESFRSASSGETQFAPPAHRAKWLLWDKLSLQEVLDFPLFEPGASLSRREFSPVEPSSASTATISQCKAREKSRVQSNTMPRPRRPWACGEPVSVAQEESRSAIRTFIHRPGCRCALCLPALGLAGQPGGAPVERHGDTYSSLEVPSPRFQAGLPVVPYPQGNYVAASPMRILSTPLGPYPGYGPGGGNTVRVESPTRIRYEVGENIITPTGYFEHQGNKASIPTMQTAYTVEGLQTPRVQTVSCNDWPPAHQPQISEQMGAHPTTGYPLATDEKYQDRHSHGRSACVPSSLPGASPHDPVPGKSPLSAVPSRAVSNDELEKLRAQQEQQQKEAEELRRRQEELEKEQSKQREELELERQHLKEQRERLEEQRHAFEQEKQEILHAQMLAISKERSRGPDSSSCVGKGIPDRLPVSNADDAFESPRSTTNRKQHGHPVRHTNSTANIVRSITGSAFGELHSDGRHGDTAVNADGTDEKASNTVGGRQENLQPTAACSRFFSRTASVDTNDEKEPTINSQDDLQTDPSMALSTALDKLSKIRMKLDALQQQLEVQSQEVSSYYNALKAADQVHSSLQQTAADCRVCYGRRHTQMQEVEKRLSVLTAQDLQPCSVDELEELAQELEGTQYKLTVVQAQRAAGAAEETHKKPKQLLPYSSSCLPEPKSSFAIPEEPVARIGPDECVAVQESALQEIKALGDDLEHIKTVHSEYKKAYKRLQGIMAQQVNSYDVDLQRLIAIEKNLEEKLRRLLFLNGDANYAELSDSQMQEYFRIVNLSIRKVYREIALRETGDRKRNEPRTSGPLHSQDCQGRNLYGCQDTCSNEPNGARKRSGGITTSEAPPLGNIAEKNEAVGHNVRDSVGTTRNCCNPVHVPFVAGSTATSIATQRMLVHDSRLTPRHTSIERTLPPE